MKVRHILWKELVLHLWPAGRPSRQTLLQWLPPIALIGTMAILIGITEDIGTGPSTTFMLPIALLFIMAALPSNIAMDSFAGERERHTLESVLATPITPRQLLWGKTLAQLTLLAGVIVIAFIVSIAIVVITSPAPDQAMPFILVLTLLTPISFIFGVFLLLAGTLASLKSANVKAAMPQMMLYLLIGMGIGIFPTAIFTPVMIAIGTDPANGPGTILLIVIGLQILTAIGFLAYMAYLLAQIMRHTEPDRFRFEV